MQYAACSTFSPSTALRVTIRTSALSHAAQLPGNRNCQRLPFGRRFNSHLAMKGPTVQWTSALDPPNESERIQPLRKVA